MVLGLLVLSISCDTYLSVPDLYQLQLSIGGFGSVTKHIVQGGIHNCYFLVVLAIAQMIEVNENIRGHKHTEDVNCSFSLSLISLSESSLPPHSITLMRLCFAREL